MDMNSFYLRKKVGAFWLRNKGFIKKRKETAFSSLKILRYLVFPSETI
jgi:hypothetical protein